MPRRARSDGIVPQPPKSCPQAGVPVIDRIRCDQDPRQQVHQLALASESIQTLSEARMVATADHAVVIGEELGDVVSHTLGMPIC